MDDGSRRSRKSSAPRRAVTESKNQGESEASDGSGQGQNQPATGTGTGTLARIVSHLRVPFFLLSRWTRTTTSPSAPTVVPIAPASEDPGSLPVTQPVVAPAVETAALADHDYSTELQNVSQPMELTVIGTETTAAAVVPLESDNAKENESEMAGQLLVEIGAVNAASAIPENINFIANVNAPAEGPKAKPPLTRGQKRKAQLDHTAGWKVKVFQLRVTAPRQVGAGTDTGAANAAASHTSQAPTPGQESTGGDAAEPKTTPMPKPAQDCKGQ